MFNMRALVTLHTFSRAQTSLLKFHVPFLCGLVAALKVLSEIYSEHNIHELFLSNTRTENAFFPVKDISRK